MVGLSAMLGTGVFAVWTPAIALAGSWLLGALLLAAIVAGLNAISTARLAIVHPESGGAYVYGRRRLHRAAGVLAGWAFVLGKSASAAAAALTIGVYVWPGHERLVAWAAIALALAIDLRGVVKSMRVNALLVTLVLLALGLVVVLGGTSSFAEGRAAGLTGHGAVSAVAAAGLLFVAFAGYARIAVLGEEVRDPSRTIPRAMMISFVAVTVVYMAVGLVILGAAGSGMTFTGAPLDDLARASSWPQSALIVTCAAVLGAGSVLISLLAGVGRTLFAMGSAGDAPRVLAAVSSRRVPHRGGLVAGVLAAVLVTLGQLAWALALSGACVLVYYSVAHAAAWTLPGRRWRVVPILGLTGCLAVFACLGAVAFTGGLVPR